MKVFISWSGQTGAEIGKLFRDWLPAVLQALRPYFSPDDIAKGARWNSEISKELESSGFGLIVATADALQSDWVMFEAGALSKKLEGTRVVPILFGIDSTDVTGPLVQFQSAQFVKSDVFRTLEAMNASLAPNALAPDVLRAVFEMWWPKLEEPVKKILAETPKSPAGAVRSDRDLLEELLVLTRSQKVDLPRGMGISTAAQADLLQCVAELLRLADEGLATDLELLSLARQLERPIRYITRRSGSDAFSSEWAEIVALRRRLEDELHKKNESAEDSNSGDES